MKGIAFWVVVVFLFQRAAFAQVNIRIIADPSLGEIQTNHNAQIAQAGVSGAGLLVSGSLIATAPLTATVLRISFPAPITSSPTTCEDSSASSIFVCPSPAAGVGPSIPAADQIRIEGATGVFASLTSPRLNTTQSRIDIVLPSSARNVLSGSFRLVGVRIDANGKTGAVSFTAALSSTANNYILSTASGTIISSIGPGIGGMAIGARSGQTNLGTASIFTNGLVPDAGASFTITEGLASAFRTATQNSNSGVPVKNGTRIRLTFNGMPAGLTLTLATNNPNGLTTSLTNSNISVVSNTSIIDFAATSLTSTETFEIEVGVVTPISAKVLVPGSISVTATLFPIGDGLNNNGTIGLGLPREDQGYPTFAQSDLGPITIATIATATEAGPIISSLNPSSAINMFPGTGQGSQSLAVMVNGSGFVNGAVVTFDVYPVNTSFINSGLLAATFAPADYFKWLSGKHSVRVTNPTGNASNTVFFDALPSITSLSPSSTSAGGSSFTLTVNATGLFLEAVVNFGETALQGTSFANGQLTRTVPASLITQSGAVNVTITSNGETSSPVPFQINPTFSLNCTPATGPPTLGVAYTATCTVTGGTSPYNWSINPGALPAGLSLSPSGNSATISGTPTASGDYNYTVRVTDSSGTPQVATQAYSGRIDGPISLNCTPATGPTAVGTAYAATCTVTGGTLPYNWSINPGTLPAGLSLSPSGSSATIGGTPTASGDYNYTVRVTDSSATPQSVTQVYRGAIASPISLNCTPATGPTAVGTAYAATCTVTGGISPFSWSISSGALPAGLTLNPAGTSATISGTPAASGIYDYTVRVTDSSPESQVSTQMYSGTIIGTVTLNCNPLTGPTTRGVAYTATCTVNGGTAPYSWSINPGTLPAGVTLNPSGSSATISGTPTAAGPYSYTVRITDSTAPPQLATQAFSGSVSPLVIPTLSLTVQPSPVPTQPSGLGLQLSGASPTELQGTLALGFRALAVGPPTGYSDPALQFTSGGKTFNFTIRAGATSVSLPQIQQGTVAGDITVSLTRLMAGTIDVTPQTPPSNTIRVPVLPPIITPDSVRIINVTTNSLDVEATAYSTPRDLFTATYTFEVASGTQIVGSAVVPVDVRSVADQWYASNQSLTYGSLVLLRMRFSVEGNPNSLPSVTVTLTNSAGTSSPVTARK